MAVLGLGFGFGASGFCRGYKHTRVFIRLESILEGLDCRV